MRMLLPISLFFILNAETQQTRYLGNMKSFQLRLARRAHEARGFLLRKGDMNSIIYKKPLFREGILSLHGVTFVTQTQLWPAIFSASSRLSASLRYFVSDRRSLGDEKIPEIDVSKGKFVPMGNRIRARS